MGSLMPGWSTDNLRSLNAEKSPDDIIETEYSYLSPSSREFMKHSGSVMVSRSLSRKSTSAAEDCHVGSPHGHAHSPSFRESFRPKETFRSGSLPARYTMSFEFEAEDTEEEKTAGKKWWNKVDSSLLNNPYDEGDAKAWRTGSYKPQYDVAKKAETQGD